MRGVAPQTSHVAEPAAAPENTGERQALTRQHAARQTAARREPGHWAGTLRRWRRSARCYAASRRAPCNQLGSQCKLAAILLAFCTYSMQKGPENRPKRHSRATERAPIRNFRVDPLSESSKNN